MKFIVNIIPIKENEGKIGTAGRMKENKHECCYLLKTAKHFFQFTTLSVSKSKSKSHIVMFPRYTSCTMVKDHWKTFLYQDSPLEPYPFRQSYTCCSEVIMHPIFWMFAPPYSASLSQLFLYVKQFSRWPNFHFQFFQ